MGQAHGQHVEPVPVERRTAVVTAVHGASGGGTLVEIPRVDLLKKAVQIRDVYAGRHRPARRFCCRDVNLPIEVIDAAADHEFTEHYSRIPQSETAARSPHRAGTPPICAAAFVTVRFCTENVPKPSPGVW